MNKPLIPKEQFVEILNFIHDQGVKFEELAEKMEALSPGYYCDFFPNQEYESRIIALLGLLLNEPDDSLIEYFIYETDFGKNDNARLTHNNIIYNISTPEQLYDAIVAINFPEVKE